MRFSLNFINGLIIGLLSAAIPFAYLYGRHTSRGVSEEFIVAAAQCRADAEKFKEMLTHVQNN